MTASMIDTPLTWGPDTTRRAPRNAVASAMRDVTTTAGRELRRTLRSVDGLITAFAIPVSIMLVFVVIFGGAIDSTGNYIDYVVPGTLVLCLGFGSAMTAIAVAQDMTSGTIDRFKTLAIFGPAVLWGHVIASVIRNLASAIVVLLVAIGLGFRPEVGLGDAAMIGAYVVLMILAFTWFSAAAGLVLSVDAAGSVNMVFLFLPYLSSGFVGVDTMPGWLHGFADNQPFTPLIETLRGVVRRSGGWRDRAHRARVVGGDPGAERLVRGAGVSATHGTLSARSARRRRG